MTDIEERGIALDVFVPTHGKLELTTRCIETLYQNTANPFHLIVTDSPDVPGDHDKTLTSVFLQGLAARYPNVTYLQKQDGWKTGNEFFNAAFQHAQTDYIAVAMNSIAFEPEWDIGALNLMRERPDVGIIGLKSILPDTHLIESAGIAMNGYTPIDIARNFPGHRQCGVYECIAVQWAFALLRKQAVVGNIENDTFFGHVGWDDIDNCFAVRKKGWKILYCGVGAGYHTPRATRGNNTIEAAAKNFYNSHQFYQRNGFWELFLKTAPDEAITQQREAIKRAIQTLTGDDQKRVIDDLSKLETDLKGAGR